MRQTRRDPSEWLLQCISAVMCQVRAQGVEDMLFSQAMLTGYGGL